MRVSHKEMKKRINQQVSQITDEELFRSSAFAAYLTDITESAVNQFKRKIRVWVYYNTDPKAFIACTDNKHIYINAGNDITNSFPTRQLKVDSLIGLDAHEIGHVLFTDFRASKVYFDEMEAGRLYPTPDYTLNEEETEALQELRDDLIAGALNKAVLMRAAKQIMNCLEDAYVESRIIDRFPGKFANGICLNNIRFCEMMPSIDEQLINGNYKFSVFCNLLIQYCRSGDINNREGYSGDVLDRFYKLLPIVDNAIYDDNMKQRFDATNRILLALWDYIEDIKADAEQYQKDHKAGNDETDQEVADKLSSQIVKLGRMALGSTKPIPSKKSGYGEEAVEKRKEIQKVMEEELGRLELIKTEDIEEGEDGGVEFNLDYEGTGYKDAANDISRLLSSVAQELVEQQMNQELSEELQEAANEIRLGNAHKGIKIIVNRMSEVPDTYINQYQSIAPPLLTISKQMQKRLQRILREQAFVGKMTGLHMGRRVEPRLLMDQEGRYFSKNKLPGEKKNLAVALLLDESGSMCSNDRVTSARAAAIVVYDFCKAMDVPVLIMGHTEYHDVEMYAYTDFDSRDARDRYRLMDISARCGNRDGAALRYVAERLMKQPEENRLLMLVSDGQPAGDGYIGTAAEADLRGIKKEFTNQGMLFVAAAIGSDKENIERIYDDAFLDITDLTKLPMLLVKKIEKELRG